MERNITEARYWGNPCPKCGMHVRCKNNRSCVNCHRVMINRRKAKRRADPQDPYREKALILSRNRMAKLRESEDFKSKEREADKERYSRGGSCRDDKITRVAERERGMRKRSLPSDRAAVLEMYRAARASGATVDHIVPLNHPDVCGLHVSWNMQLLSREDNSRKGNKFDETLGIARR